MLVIKKMLKFVFSIFREFQGIIILGVFILVYFFKSNLIFEIVLLLVFLSLAYDFFQWIVDPKLSNLNKKIDDSDSKQKGSDPNEIKK